MCYSGGRLYNYSISMSVVWENTRRTQLKRKVSDRVRMIKVDVGHLAADGLNLDRHTQAFRGFQSALEAGDTPLTLSLNEGEKIPRIRTLADELKAKYENILLLGIGGSALGARAVLQFLKGPYYNLEGHPEPRMFIFDNLDPVLADKLERLLDFSKTAIIYTSKSGSTPETAANFTYFYERYRAAGGNPEDIVIMCDPADNGINRIARRLGCRLFHIPRDLPGRYSVLSSVGFLPAELVGIDSARLLAGAQSMHRHIVSTPAAENALFLLGGSLYELSTRGKSVHVLFNYSNLLFEFGLWFMQLWAESLGKRVSVSGEVVHAGSTPLAAVGATDQHSLLQLFKEGPADKVFGFITIDRLPDLVMGDLFPSEVEYSYFAGRTLREQIHIEQLSTEMSLVRSAHPCYRITLEAVTPEVLGGLFYFYEALVVYIARLWKINPFDQPGVEEGKRITYALMGRRDYADKRAAYEQDVAAHTARGRVIEIK